MHSMKWVQCCLYVVLICSVLRRILGSINITYFLKQLFSKTWFYCPFNKSEWVYFINYSSCWYLQLLAKLFKSSDCLLMLLTKWERLKRLWKIVLDSDKLSREIWSILRRIAVTKLCCQQFYPNSLNQHLSVKQLKY
jgi:hypothetical protein